MTLDLTVISWIWYQSPDGKNKNRQMELHKAQISMYSKGNNEKSEMATYRMGEYICKSYIWQWLNI